MKLAIKTDRSDARGGCSRLGFSSRSGNGWNVQQGGKSKVNSVHPPVKALVFKVNHES